MSTKIKAVWAREITSRDAFPAIESTVLTEGDAKGIAVAAAGSSVGEYEARFVYDGGERYHGRGVLTAVHNVNTTLAPALTGIDVTKQREIDTIMIKLDGTSNKSRLGANATASVSAAVLKAAANSLKQPLYRYIGGVNACILPIPMTNVRAGGSRRYGGGTRGGGKPVYEFMSYGADTFSEAVYMGWQLSQKYKETSTNKFHLDSRKNHDLTGVITHDTEILDIMVETINELGLKNKVGIHIDVAAGCFMENDRFVGLFSREDKTREDLLDLYRDWCMTYPIIDLEDPLDDEDFTGHAILVKELGIQITGDDLYATNPQRLQQGIELKSANSVVLKVPQIGTITEAFDMIQLAFRNGYRILPGASRGSGVDGSLADYAVGFNTGQTKSAGYGTPLLNRYLAIEKELDTSARFLGIEALNLNK